MNKKGYAIVLDAIFALAFILVILLGITAVYQYKTEETSFKKLHYTTEDMLDTLNKQGILDSIGEEWAAANGSMNSTHWLNAENMSRTYLEQLIPENIGYRLLVEDEVIAENTTRVNEDEALSKTNSVRLLVGYGKGLPTRGYVGRAFLTNIREKTTSIYTYFGGFVGQGNVTRYVRDIPDDATILQACWEANFGDSFDFYVNDVDAGTFTPSGGGMTANVKGPSGCVSNPESYFTSGDNKIEVRFTGEDLSAQYIGGGYFRVTFNTSEADTNEEKNTDRYWFPGIQGLVNHYSSLYVPGTLESMNIFLHFDSNYTTFLTIGDTLVFDSSENESEDYCVISDTEYSCTIADENISSELDYVGLSKKTTPIRIGTGNVSYIVMEGNADVILTTDLSFSMWEDRCMEGGWHTVYDRDDPLLDDTTEAEHICTSDCVKPGGGLCHYGDGCSGCNYGCWRSYGCGINDGSQCSLPCYACVWYGAEADSPSGRPYGGDYCYDCTNLGCVYCFEYNEVDEWCTLNCGPNVYAYFGVNGTATDPYEPAPPGQCSLYTCTSTTRATCFFYNYHTCDQDYVHQHATYDADGLPRISHLTCPNKCFECNLTGVGLAQQLNMDFTTNILNVSGNNVGLLSYGDDTYDTHVLSNDTTSLNAEIGSYIAGGETCICCALEDSISLLSGSNTSRNKFILLMTDGEANVRCNNALSDLDDDGQITAKDDAIQYACDAHNDYNITVYSVGFGSDAGASTLQAIADCGNGSFYASNDTEELEEVYDEIAGRIVESSYISQIINITGALDTSTLYSDSYIEFNYIPVNTTGYAEISLTLSTEPFNDTATCTGVLYVPPETRIVDAKVTSYSSEHWTDHLRVENIQYSQEVYRLWSDFGGMEYSSLGDPYIVNAPVEYLLPGVDNHLTIETGDTFENRTGCSRDNRAVYTIKLRPLVKYGNVFIGEEGCHWTIEFEDATQIEVNIPETYNGAEECFYTPSQITQSETDAIDDAIYRLLKHLDIDDNGQIEIKFDEELINFELSRAGGVKSLWGPTKFKLILWM